MSTIHIPSLAYLHDAAQEFLRAVGPAPRVVAFYGEMGAGDAINSPTFAIVNEYVGRDADHLIYHFDFYRIRTLAEALDIGTEDYFERPSWSFIEWPERIESLLPPQAVRVHITEQADGARELTISD